MGVLLHQKCKEKTLERKVVSVIKKSKSRQQWTQDEVNFILKHIGPMSDQAVAAHIGKSVDSVRKWVQRYDDKRLCR